MSPVEGGGPGPIAWCRVPSPVGPLVLAGGSGSLMLVSFDEPGTALHPLGGARLVESEESLGRAITELEEYFSGRRRVFDLELDRGLAHGFYAAVLAKLEEVPYGEVVTYGQLAAAAGSPGAARAVGSAMAQNPLAIVVPCHRVVRAGGRFGQYGGGSNAKRWLLDHEGAGRHLR